MVFVLPSINFLTPESSLTYFVNFHNFNDLHGSHLTTLLTGLWNGIQLYNGKKNHSNTI